MSRLSGSSSYPFPHDDFQVEVERYPRARDIIWCQEEPGNQGAWHRIQHYLLRHKRPDQVLGYALRPSSASPAVGYLAKAQSSAKAIGRGGVSRENLREKPCSSKSKFPLLSESVAEATLLSWKKKEGEHVDRDENLIESKPIKSYWNCPHPLQAC